MPRGFPRQRSERYTFILVDKINCAAYNNNINNSNETNNTNSTNNINLGNFIRRGQECVAITRRTRRRPFLYPHPTHLYSGRLTRLKEQNIDFEQPQFTALTQFLYISYFTSKLIELNINK